MNTNTNTNTLHIDISTDVALICDDDPTISVVNFVGECDYGGVEIAISLDQLIDNYINKNIIHGGTIRQGHKNEILGTLRAMKYIIKESIKRVKNLPLLDDADYFDCDDCDDCDDCGGCSCSCYDERLV